MANCILTFKSNATCTWNPGVFQVTTVEEPPSIKFKKRPKFKFAQSLNWKKNLTMQKKYVCPCTEKRKT